MNFLNVGPWELMVIMIIAILLIGPRRVVEIVQAIRRFAGQLRGMSNEFTSLIHAEVQASEDEVSQAPGDMTDDESVSIPGDQDTSRGTKREPEGLKDVVKEGLAPIMGIQAELQATAQETRQALESVVKEGLVEPITGIQAELQDAAQETRQALKTPIQDEPGSASGIPAELRATVRETRQTLENIATEIAEGGQRAKEEQNDETG